VAPTYDEKYDMLLKEAFRGYYALHRHRASKQASFAKFCGEVVKRGHDLSELSTAKFARWMDSTLALRFMRDEVGLQLGEIRQVRDFVNSMAVEEQKLERLAAAK